MSANAIDEKKPSAADNLLQMWEPVVEINSDDNQVETEQNTAVVDLKDQIGMGLSSSRITYVERLRENIRRWEGLINVLPFWRNAVNPVNLTFAIITVAILSMLIYSNFQSLPAQVPFIYSQVEKSWSLLDKSFLILIPPFLAVLEIFVLRLQRVVFDFDRRLSSVIAITQAFSNLLLIIAILQIMSLVLI